MKPYVRIASWHIRRDGLLTLCGRYAKLNVRAEADELPMGERSCESCLRLARRLTDTAAVYATEQGASE